MVLRILLPAGLVVGLIGWWLWNWRRDGDWRLGPILVVVPLVLFTGNEARWAYTEARFADAVRPVAQLKGGDIGCERVMRNFFSSQGRVGHVWFDADGTPVGPAFLSMSTCARLKEFRRHPDRVELDHVVAAHTLAHEAAHLSGERDESAAECLALAHDVQVMQRLGADVAAAERYHGWYLTQVYPRLPSEYRDAC